MSMAMCAFPNFRDKATAQDEVTDSRILKCVTVQDNIVICVHVTCLSSIESDRMTASIGAGHRFC
jgi:hypothetical protein